MRHYSVEQQLTLPAPDPGVVALSVSFLRPRSTILDVGCGNGRNSIHLAQQGHNVIGIDKSPEMISKAREWAGALGATALRLSFEEADMLELEYPAGSFDAVFATRSLQELRDGPQAYEAIKNVQEVTAPQGRNFVTCYIGTQLEQASKPHLTIFNPGEIADFYERRGWSIMRSYQSIKKPLVQSQGPTLLRSYDEIVAQKPA